MHQGIFIGHAAFDTLYLLLGVKGSADIFNLYIIIQLYIYLLGGLSLSMRGKQLLNQGKGLEKVVNCRFHFIRIIRSMRCTELEAPIGVVQLDNIGKIVKRRVEIAKKFILELKIYSDRIQLPSTPIDRTHGFMLFLNSLAGCKIREAC